MGEAPRPVPAGVPSHPPRPRVTRPPGHRHGARFGSRYGFGGARPPGRPSTAR
jgi:hypothetical protein